MNKDDYYAEIGMKAARRAARKVIEQANRENRPILVCKNDKVEYEIPSSLDKQKRSTQKTQD